MLKLVAALLFVMLHSASPFSPGPARADEGEPPDLRSSPGALMFKAPLSGPLAPFGEEARQGAELALKTWGGGLKLALVDEAAAETGPLLGEVALVLGYFTESNFREDAPKYIFAKKPVLMPFFMTNAASAHGHENFFRLMPSLQEQGVFMALEMLRMTRRPRVILIITNDEDQSHEQALAEALQETLAEPPAPAPPQAAGEAKPPKAAPPLKPLDKKALVLTVPASRLMSPDGLSELGKNAPDIIVLAVDQSRALDLAPWLAASKFSKAPLWGGASLAFREVGAAFAALDLNLKITLPVNLANEKNAAVAEFNRGYIEKWRARPTWLAAMAYDAMNIAIKAVSSGETSADMLAFLTGQSFHSLTVYQLAPGGQGQTPVEFMPVTKETLCRLP
ncbi:MAG: ABC transporter substrate-binding protein [Candidatus Adiutrix sp.]|jgi:ABC-type branched-subunit amino acid transport system substrate-binding protein|nr:ABC transporter substrate-binding protein [Candidatus Adiutrix sp.]